MAAGVLGVVISSKLIGISVCDMHGRTKYSSG
jgi:hypothetical protein